MSLVFGDPDSIRKRDEAREEAERLEMFPDAKIVDLIVTLQDHFDLSSIPGYRQKQEIVKVIRRWLKDCWPV